MQERSLKNLNLNSRCGLFIELLIVRNAFSFELSELPELQLSRLNQKRVAEDFLTCDRTSTVHVDYFANMYYSFYSQQ
jgi:hypothetical protein